MMNNINTQDQSKNLDLNIDMFATIAGVMGKQFGKTIYSSVLKFKDLQKFLDIFPNVQRGVSMNRVRSVKKYVIEGMKNKDLQAMRFFSAITVTCRGAMFYNEETGSIAIDTRNKLSINDGQHVRQ